MQPPGQAGQLSLWFDLRAIQARGGKGGFLFMQTGSIDQEVTGLKDTDQEQRGLWDSQAGDQGQGATVGGLECSAMVAAASDSPSGRVSLLPRVRSVTERCSTSRSPTTSMNGTFATSPSRIFFETDSGRTSTSARRPAHLSAPCTSAAYPA